MNHKRSYLSIAHSSVISTFMTVIAASHPHNSFVAVIQVLLTRP